MDLVDSNHKPGTALGQESQQVLSERPPCDLPFRGKLGGDAESHGGNGGDAPGLWTFS
ncbi:hypothetical protein [Arthrobacter sp. NA-172]|uniref:hypothetical protein n=1 Tax=Arthrobacter sp. NA-172 TaxID=3367524 RepID=UPI0037545560